MALAHRLGRRGVGRARRWLPVFGLLSLRQEAADLLVRRLCEIVIPVADGEKRPGVMAQMISSASAPNASQVSGEAVGTATTIRAGCCCRNARMAARIVAPVASPSSTRITVRPRRSGGGRLPR